jgi:uncharacterized coiled-coil DUF342 family protein
MPGILEEIFGQVRTLNETANAINHQLSDSLAVQEDIIDRIHLIFAGMDMDIEDMEDRVQERLERLRRGVRRTKDPEVSDGPTSP